MLSFLSDHHLSHQESDNRKKTILNFEQWIGLLTGNIKEPEITEQRSWEDWNNLKKVWKTAVTFFYEALIVSKRCRDTNQKSTK